MHPRSDDSLASFVKVLKASLQGQPRSTLEQAYKHLVQRVGWVQSPAFSIDAVFEQSEDSGCIATLLELSSNLARAVSVLSEVLAAPINATVNESAIDAMYSVLTNHKSMTHANMPYLHRITKLLLVNSSHRHLESWSRLLSQVVVYWSTCPSDRKLLVSFLSGSALGGDAPATAVHLRDALRCALVATINRRTDSENTGDDDDDETELLELEQMQLVVGILTGTDTPEAVEAYLRTLTTSPAHIRKACVSLLHCSSDDIEASIAQMHGSDESDEDGDEEGEDNGEVASSDSAARDEYDYNDGFTVKDDDGLDSDEDYEEESTDDSSDESSESDEYDASSSDSEVADSSHHANSGQKRKAHNSMDITLHRKTRRTHSRAARCCRS